MESFESLLDSLLLYIVGVTYFVITLIVEIPTVYLTMKKFASDNKKLLYTIVGANVLTTILTAVLERIICAGLW